MTEEDEFREIYKLDVIEIPHQPPDDPPGSAGRRL